MDCPRQVAGCVFTPGTGRHKHVAADLRMIGQACYCGANEWVIIFGGPLPARISCDNCQQGFNLAERLRSCGRPETLTRNRRVNRA